jgi:predicted regulator of Ras-like GTPase activity (Roadblock/LC7/MglB family)
MTDLHSDSLLGGSRSDRLDRAIHALLAQTPEIEAAAVVSFDGLPMAAALPPSMDEDRVAAMSAALLSLGERAAQGLGRGELSQVYIEGDAGTVFLISADDEAVLVAVASKGAKVGMMLYEVKRAAAAVAEVLRAEEAEVVVAPAPVEAPAAVPAQPEPVAQAVAAPVEPVYSPPTYATQNDSSWSSSYAPTGSVMPGGGVPPSTWS